MSTGVVFDAVAQLRAAVDGLLGGGLDGLSGLQVAGLIEDLEVERRRLDAVDSQVLAAADRRGVAGEFGRTSTADLLTVRCRVDGREAKARVERARVLAPRVAVSGEALDALLPATAAALEAGEVGPSHVRVIAETMGRVDDLPCAVEAAGPVERYLVEAARHEDPRALRHTAALVLHRLDPDGAEPREELVARRRALTISQRGDGSVAIAGRLTATCAAVWQTVLDSLSAPNPADDGTVDERTATQGRHDGFEEAGLRLLRTGTLPSSGGVPVTVLVTTTAGDLADPAGVGRTGHGQIITLRRLLALADSEIRYTTMSIAGEILNHGRTKRRATPAQRRALASRDGGCCFPGCTRPAAWTETHHVIAWLDGGPTDIDNLCLVCPFHHRLLDRGDWHIVMIDGRPHWRPPPWLDPERRPQLNTVNHLPEIDFGVDIDIGDVDETGETGGVGREHRW